jgi:HD superfamily phosphohydrolase YqeK
MVAILPVALIWWLHAAGVVSSPWLCIALAIALSLAASLAGNAYWKRRAGPRDLLFSELLPWGWLRRVQVERQLAGAVGALGLADVETHAHGDGDTAQQKSGLLRQLAFALDAQDPYTEGHSRRVAGHAVMIARRMGLSNEQVTKVRAAAAVHDIGKLRVPSELLNKTGSLTPEEFEIVKRHATAGAEIVACLDDPELSQSVRHHHERFDGAGYPDGLLGQQIPLGARIIAVADTFDALTSVRPYREATPHKQAMDVLVSTSGTQLDPVAVRAFLRCYSGNRALLFWTVLAASPRSALAWLRGKNPAPANFSLGATMASVAAITGIAASSTPTAVSAGSARFLVEQARDLPAHSLAAPRRHASSSIRLTAAHPPTATRRLAHPRQRSRAAAAGFVAPTGSSLGGGSATRPGGKPKVGSSPKPSSRSAPKQTGGKTHKIPKPRSRGGGGTTGGSPGPPPRPGPGPPTSGGPPGGSGGSGGGTGGSGGGGPPLEPVSKDQCKNGGYVQFGFPNQGQCIAYVEHHSH